MIRELAIVIYLVFFRVVFTFFKLFPHQDKTFFVTYFGYNALHVIEQIENKSDEKIIISQGKHCHVNFQETRKRQVIDLSGGHLINWLCFVYHLATSNKVFADNYYGFLAVTNFKKNTKCIQLWHAAGAIKKFGLTDVSVETRYKWAKNRFAKVYQRFDHVVIGSEEMNGIFQASFGISEDKMIRTGVPRTDFFFDNTKKDLAISQLKQKYKIINGKKVILYAPTFRDHQKNIHELPFSIEEMHQALKDEYVLIIKNHPIVKNNIQNKYADFVLDLSHYENINHLLLLTDILISDYSSIPFEFSLLERPMIFYSYDLKEYIEERGVWGNYEELIPGPIAHNTEEIISLIKEDAFDIEKICAFKAKWNAYSTGNSSQNLVELLYSTKH